MPTPASASNKPRLVNARAIGLPVASGILLAAAMPNHGLAFLAWVAFIPLLIACTTCRPGTAALAGFLTAAACGAILAGPVESWRHVGNVAAVFAILGMVFAFIAAAASAGAGRMHPSLWPFFVASAAVTAEFLGSFLFPLNVGVTQFRNAAMLGMASYTGIWGASFLIWLSSASIVTTLRGVRPAIPALLMTLLVAVLFAATGSANCPARGRVVAAAVQAGTPGNSAALTRTLPSSAKLVVWPEQLMHVWDSPAFRSAARKGVYLVASFCRHDGKQRYNTARLISPGGATLGVFEKQLLFGKENFFFSHGRGGKPVQCGDFRVGALICFDTEGTDAARKLALDGAQIILVPNHDPELPNSVFNHLHGAIISFRAAENRVPIVWADVRGLSRIVDGSGRIVAVAPARAQTAIWASVPLRDGTTLFTRFGNWFAYLNVFAFVAYLTWAKRRPRMTAST